MDDLTTLLHEAVEDVEPTDRLRAIRQQTHRPSRGRWYAVGGAVLATAAVVTGIAVLAQPSTDPGPGPSTSTPRATESATPSTHTVAVYYLGSTPRGPRLFREFHQRTGAATLDEALAELSRDPNDPDYTTHWVPGGLGPVTVRDGVIRVDVVGASVHDQRPGTTREESELSIQQVVYTLQAAAGARLPVLFLSDGQPIDTVYGVLTSDPVVNADEVEVLALVSISNPTQDRAVSGLFSADGVASSFEGSVPWRIEDASGAPVLSGAGQGTMMADHLTPWRTGPIDVSGLPAGTYTFVASTDDPTGGTEGSGPTSDTRTIRIE